MQISISIIMYINIICNNYLLIQYFILLSNRIKIMFLVLLGNFENSIKKRRYLLDFKREYPSIKILIGMSLKEKICAIIYNFSLQLLCGLFDIKYLLK